MRAFPILILCVFLLPACPSRQEAESARVNASESALRTPSASPAATPTPSGPAKDGVAVQSSSRFLAEPMQVEVAEYPTAALPVWRQCRETRPTLVLLSNDPFLERIPTQLTREIERLLGEGSDEELLARSVPYRPDPLLMPSMAVDAALRAGYFGKVVWVLPTESEEKKLSVEAFRKQLLDFGAIDKEEARTLQLKGDEFSGTIRGIPWTAVSLFEFKGVDGPVVVHIDLTFLRPLYRSEIKTPLHPLVGGVFRILQKADLHACAVTISQSQIGRQVPLDTRFLGTTMAALVKDPAILDGPLPINWERRGQIFYLQNFFEKERINKLALAMAEDAPKDPSVHYALYQSYREMKDGDHALQSLDRAVALDKVYALEYLELTEMAKSKGRPDEALRMFGLAEKAFPDNPFITLEKARFLLSVGEEKEALPLIKRLKGLRWSPTYWGDIPKLLKEGEEKARISS